MSTKRTKKRFTNTDILPFVTIAGMMNVRDSTQSKAVKPQLIMNKIRKYVFLLRFSLLAAYYEAIKIASKRSVKKRSDN